MSYRQHIDTLIRLQNGRCHYCWDPMGGNPNDPSYPTVDHIVPQSRGGSRAIAYGFFLWPSCRYTGFRKPQCGCIRSPITNSVVTVR